MVVLDVCFGRAFVDQVAYRYVYVCSVPVLTVSQFSFLSSDFENSRQHTMVGDFLLLPAGERPLWRLERHQLIPDPIRL
jgi:hypothetical protein